MTAFADALDDLYADDNLGVDIVWTPKGGGGPHDLRALRVLGDRVALVESVGQGVMTPRTLMVRASEVETRAPGVKPLAGDEIGLGSASRKINGSPRMEDDHRLQWTIELG